MSANDSFRSILQSMYQVRGFTNLQHFLFLKVDTLKSAIEYISFMTKLLQTGNEEYQQPKKKVVVFKKIKSEYLYYYF